MMKKRILAAFLALVMVVSGIYFVKPDTEEVKAAGTVANAEVPTEMLGVKMQAKVHDKGTVNDPTDDTMDLRILSSVDSLDYKEVGFYVWYDAAAKAPTDTNRTAHFKTTTVFKRIGATSKVAYKFSPKMIDTCAEYFVSGTIMGIKYDNWGKDFYIQAYCVTNDNQTVTGVGRYFNVADASSKTVINIPIAMPADGITVGSTTKVTVGDTLTDATVEAYLDGHAHLNVQVADKTKLPSASKVEHVIIPEGGEVEYLATGNKAIYRNLETSYKGTGTEDTSWYTVYEAEGEKEFIIVTDAELYGLSTLAKNDTLEDNTFYVVSDIEVNKGKASATTFTPDTNTTRYEWSPIGNKNNAFAGTFDGQNHTISGVYFEETSVNNQWGFFGTTGDCTITNFVLENSYMGITATSQIQLGVIAGNSSGEFRNIKVAEDVYVVHTSTHGTPSTGGIVGLMTGTSGKRTIANCWFEGTLTSKGQVGGILGHASAISSLTMENCLYSGNIVINNGGCIGGLCGEAYQAAITMRDCLVTGTVEGTTIPQTAAAIIGYVRSVYNATTDTHVATLNNVYAIVDNTWARYVQTTSSGKVSLEGTTQGGAIITPAVNANRFVTMSSAQGVNGYINMGFDFTVGDAHVGYWSTVASGTPVLSSFVDSQETLAIDKVTTPRTAWYKETATEYTLYTAADMYGFASLTDVDFAEKTVKLGADITLNEGQATPTGFTPATESTTLIQWTPKYMAGTFDGDGHTIRGLYLNTGKGNAGLFASVTGTVKDFRLLNSYIKCTDQTAKDYASTNYLYGTGSIAGSLNGTMDTVYSDAIVYHDRAYAGGLVGTVYGTGTNVITNSCFAGRITARNAVAGIAGMVINTSVNVEHCLNVGTIATTDSVIGALVGYIRVTDGDSSHVFSMDDCLNVGRRDVTTEGTSTQAWAAGIIGFTGGTTVDTAYVNNTFYIRNYADENNTWVRFNYGTIGYKNVASTINFNTYNPMTELAVLQHRVGLSFQVEGEDNSQNYWVARDSKIPMLESFEDLLTNVTY